MKNIKEAENNVALEGILYEVDLDKRVDSTGKNFIAGKVTILVPQKIGEVEEEDRISVNLFAYQYYKNGNESQAYTNLEDVMTSFTSVAALEKEVLSSKDAIAQADRVRMDARYGTLFLNKFPDKKTGQDIENIGIRGSFLKKGKANADAQSAFFEEVLIKSIEPEMKNDEKTGRLVMEAFVPQWDGSMDKLNFVVEDKKAIAYIQSNWNERDTVRIEGRIRNTVVKTENESSAQLGFGNHIKETSEKVVFELVVTGGSAGRYDSDIAYDVDEVLEVLNKKEEAYQAKKNSQTSSPKVDRGF